MRVCCLSILLLIIVDIAAMDIAAMDIATMDIATMDIATMDIATMDIATKDIADAQPQVSRYQVHELTFEGPNLEATQSPVRDISLLTEWQHDSGAPTYRIYGFWDGDGEGGADGSVFKVRFCPTQAGEWHLINVESNEASLEEQHSGYTLTCVESDYPGFWVVDSTQAGSRWFQRSDGSHPYILGNTMYSFLSEYEEEAPTGGSIESDVRGNAQYFKKIRFGITGDRYPHPTDKPFLDNDGRPTDDGNFSHRPNPAWFHQRLDGAVQTAMEEDLIADLILNGPDAEGARSALAAGENDGDATPFLRYMTARYGSYPNVWMCLSNEYDIKTPQYSEEQIVAFGQELRQLLPYPTPLSVHAAPHDWRQELNTDDWHTHTIIQFKLKSLGAAADIIARNYYAGGNKPVINDELAYEGEGDGWNEADVMEAHLGALLGGGYGSTGHKPANKKGHYFQGNFRPEEHQAADNLRFLREVVDEHITFWRMEPAHYDYTQGLSSSIFRNITDTFRALHWPRHEYVLGTDRAKDISIYLPEGQWSVTAFDLQNKKQETLHESAEGKLQITTPDSRAGIIHVKKIK